VKDAAALPQKLAMRRFGHGERQVLAIHCTLAHSGAWRGLAEAMDTEITLTGVDMLSHGRSPDWDRQGVFQDRIVAATAPFLHRKMDLIGHSFGATVALRLALEYPDKVRSLTMIEPVFFAVALQDDAKLVQLHDSDSAGFFAALRAGNDALAARLFNRMWASEDAPRWPQLPEATREAMIRAIRVVPACRVSLYDDLAGLLRPGVLARVRAPVLLLAGRDTHPVIGAINEGLARRLPDAQSHVIAGAGHMLPISHPAETAAQLRALLVRAPL
jgi:lipase